MERLENFIQKKEKNRIFIPRDVEEEMKTRNCQKISRPIRDVIIQVNLYTIKIWPIAGKFLIFEQFIKEKPEEKSWTKFKMEK